METAEDRYRDVAKFLYGDDDIEIDEKAEVSIVGQSIGRHGAWVAAWVWVDRSDMEGDI